MVVGGYCRQQPCSHRILPAATVVWPWAKAAFTAWGIRVSGTRWATGASGRATRTHWPTLPKVATAARAIITITAAGATVTITVAAAITIATTITIAAATGATSGHRAFASATEATARTAWATIRATAWAAFAIQFGLRRHLTTQGCAA